MISNLAGSYLASLDSRIGDCEDDMSVCQTNISSLGIRMDTAEGLISGKAPLIHAHVANDISDATTVGKNVLTASSQGNARSAIGAGTSSFSGSYTDLSNKPASRSFTNNASRSFVSVAAAANGFQISSTRDASVSYNVTVSAAVQIGVVTNVGGYAALEIAATNSSTAGDWTEISRVGTGQNIGLAIALSSTQTVSGVLSGIVPAGYYARLRTVNSNGTPTYTYLSGQEVLQVMP